MFIFFLESSLVSSSELSLGDDLFLCREDHGKEVEVNVPLCNTTEIMERLIIVIIMLLQRQTHWLSLYKYMTLPGHENFVFISLIFQSWKDYLEVFISLLWIWIVFISLIFLTWTDYLEMFIFLFLDLDVHFSHLSDMDRYLEVFISLFWIIKCLNVYFTPYPDF